MIYRIHKNEPERDKMVWAILHAEPKQMAYMGEKWFVKFGHYPQTCADTREELLIHMISRQQKIIADSEVEIERLSQMREVPDESESPKIRGINETFGR